MIAEPYTFTPRASLLRVRLTQAAGVTPGGIILPDSAQKRPCEATVVAVGDGRSIPGTSLRTTVWPQPNDIVIFKSADFQQVGEDPREGLVLAEHVVAMVDPDTGEVTPEGEYVKLDADPTEGVSRGGIILPERSREQAKSGIILDFGPGEVVLWGRWYGTRRSVRVIMSVDDEEPLVGRTAYWAGEEKSLYLSGEDPCVLIPASDIFALEDD